MDDIPNEVAIKYICRHTIPAVKEKLGLSTEREVLELIKELKLTTNFLQFMVIKKHGRKTAYLSDYGIECLILGLPNEVEINPYLEKPKKSRGKK